MMKRFQNFAFNFELRRYSKGETREQLVSAMRELRDSGVDVAGGSLRTSTAPTLNEFNLLLLLRVPV